MNYDELVVLLRTRGTQQIYLPEGWASLVAELDAKLTEINPDYRLDQVKEKFGGLRYYFESDVEFERMQTIVREAEERSYTVCQVCGAPGKCASRPYWYSTLCDAHAKEASDAAKKDSSDAR